MLVVTKILIKNISVSLQNLEIISLRLKCLRVSAPSPGLPVSCLHP